MVAATSQGSSAAVVVYLAVAILTLASWWKILSKAGRPGWGAIIPIYGTYLECKVAKRPGWWWLLFLIPIVNVVVYIIVMIDIAKAFGKGTGFGLGLVFLPPIFAAILGFGSAQYQHAEA